MKFYDQNLNWFYLSVNLFRTKTNTEDHGASTPVNSSDVSDDGNC